MNRIEDHIKHSGKGVTRQTRCVHCDKLFTSGSKDRWRQHMHRCPRLALEDQQLFESGDQRVSGRSRRLSETEEAEEEEEVVTVVTEASTQEPIERASGQPAETSFLATRDEDAAAAAAVLEEETAESTEVLLIHGPCSFVQDRWTCEDVSKADLLGEIQMSAVEADVLLTARESNHKGTILDWLLNARASEVIVLCWVGPLSESPLVLRALELVKNRVIVVSPNGVEHGKLPPTVVGVMIGFGLQSIGLAFLAAKNLSAVRQ